MFFQDDVGVHAPGADRGDAGAARQLAAIRIPLARPRREFALYVKRCFVERNVGVEGLGIQRRNDLPALHLQQHLDDSRQTGRRQQMGDIGFDRADGAELDLRRVFAKRLGQRLDLDGIAEGGARSVSLDISEGPRIDRRVGQGALDGLCLLDRRRYGKAVANARIADVGPLDHRVDVIAVALGVRHGFEHQGADPFADDGAVGAQPISADHLGGLGSKVFLRGGNQLLWMQKQADTAGQGHVTASGPQHVHRLVNAGRRSRAHGVEKIGRPGEAVEIGHHVGQGAGVAAARRRAAHQHVLETEIVVLVGHRADDHRDVAVVARLQVFARIPRVLEGLDTGFEEQPNLRRHQFGFVLRDAEVARIEPIDVVDEGPGLDHGLAEHVALGVEQRVVVPARRRIAFEAVPPAGEHLPEGLLVRRLGHPQRQADNGDVMTVVDGARLARHDLRFIALWSGRNSFFLNGNRRAFRLCRRICEKARQDIAMGLGQMGGDSGEIDVFEEQRLGQRAELFLQPVGHLDDNDRIEPVFLQLAVCLDLPRFHLDGIGEQILEHVDRVSEQVVIFDHPARGGNGCRHGGRRRRHTVPIQEGIHAIGITVKHGPSRRSGTLHQCLECPCAHFRRQRDGSESTVQCRQRCLVHAHAAVRPQRPGD